MKVDEICREDNANTFFIMKSLLSSITSTNNLKYLLVN